MLKIKSKQIGLFIGDIVLFVLSLYLSLLIRGLEIPGKEDFLYHFIIFIPLIVILFTLYYSFDFYDFLPIQNKIKQITRIINIYLFLLAVGFAYFYLFSASIPISPKTILFLCVLIGLIFAVLWRVFLMPTFLLPATKVKTLLIAGDYEYNELKEMVNAHDYYPFYFVNHLDITAEDLSSEENSINKLKQIFEENNITQVVVDIRDQRTSTVLPFLYNLASQRKITVFDAASVYQDILKKMPMRGIGHFWFFESVNLNIHAYEAAKRVIDIIASILLLIPYALIFPFICLAIKWDDGGPILSIQKRYGHGGKILNIYKLRTMDFTDEGEWIKHNNINKITRVGAFLRKTRLDEFTQLWNVLIGDVSLIGPRSDILANGAKLSAQIPYYMMRYTVLPGLSGWAQVNQEDQPNSFEETRVRLQYDLYYVKNRSLLLDLIIAIRTFKVLISRTGV